MWRILVLTAFLAIGSVGHAQAQTKKELVAKLLQLQQPGIENVGRQVAGQISQRFMQAAGQALPRLPADKREAAAKDIQTEVKKFYDEVEPLLRKRAIELAPTTLAPVYEERFTEDELRQAIAWLESPTSKKLQQAEGELGSALAQKVVADTRATVEPKAKALEASLGKRLGMAPAPNGAPAASSASRPAPPPKK